MDFGKLCQETIQKLLDLQNKEQEINHITKIIFNALKNKRKLPILGNGASPKVTKKFHLL